MSDTATLIISVVFFLVIAIVVVFVGSIINKAIRGVRSTKRKIIKIKRAASDIEEIVDLFSDKGDISDVIRTTHVSPTSTRITKVTMTSTGDIPDDIKEIIQSGFSAQLTKQPKSIGGATNIYLPMIQKDFPEYHNSNAESDIKSVIRDYIKCIHNGETSFKSDAVNQNALGNIIPKKNGTVTDLIFHKVAILNYQKTMDYATVVYGTSFGYKLNGVQIETAYELHYTLQLREQGVASKALRCSNCNAPLDKLTYMTVCPYCETKIMRDTILNWIVSDIRELG